MNIASIKARLRNIADKNGRTFQDVLVMYGLERTIYRLSVSEYGNRFTLKGGIFLYGLAGGDFARTTTDIDLLGHDISNDTEQLREVFRVVFAIECDDGIRFDLDTLSAKTITEFKKYSGANISIMGYLDKTRLPVSIDIGFGDVIYPDVTRMEFPVLLDDFEPAVINAYSLESSIAEKFEAIVSLGYNNGRFKDFYDIYVLAGSHDFEGRTIKTAFVETFKHRKTSLEIIAAFEDDFCEDPVRKSRWNAFAKKKRISLDLTLEETIAEIQKFTAPIIDAVRNEKDLLMTWDHRERRWGKPEDLHGYAQ